MEKEFEAYYAKAYVWIFAILVVLCIFGMILLSIFWIPEISLIFIIALSVVSPIFASIFIVFIRRSGIAVELTGGRLLLHKKELIEIPVEDVLKISINAGNGSFDISVKTPTKKYRMHCFVKEQRKKKTEFVALLRSKGIRVDTYHINHIRVR